MRRLNAVAGREKVRERHIALGTLRRLVAGITITHMKILLTVCRDVWGCLLHHHSMPSPLPRFLENKKGAGTRRPLGERAYSRRVAIRRFGESSSSSAWQTSLTRTSASIADLVKAPSLPMTAIESTLAGNTWMSFLPLPMLAVFWQPSSWHRQGFALGRYSAVGVSGDNINFDACLVDLAQQLLDAFQHLAVLCDCSIEIKDQIFDFKLAPAGDLCFHHKNAPLFLYILSIMLSHNQYSIF